MCILPRQRLLGQWTRHKVSNLDLAILDPPSCQTFCLQSAFPEYFGRGSAVFLAAFCPWHFFSILVFWHFLNIFAFLHWYFVSEFLHFLSIFAFPEHFSIFAFLEYFGILDWESGVVPAAFWFWCRCRHQRQFGGKPCLASRTRQRESRQRHLDQNHHQYYFNGRRPSTQSSFAGAWQLESISSLTAFSLGLSLPAGTWPDARAFLKTSWEPPKNIYFCLFVFLSLNKQQHRH